MELNLHKNDENWRIQLEEEIQKRVDSEAMIDGLEDKIR